MSHVTRTPLSRSKGQLDADVLNSQHAGTGATWRINTKILLCRNSTATWRINVKILSTCRGRRHIVSPRAELVLTERESDYCHNLIISSTWQLSIEL